MSAALNPHQDPLRDLPPTDHEAFSKGPVRVQDILTFAYAMDHRKKGETPTRPPEPEDFTSKEIGIAHDVALLMNDQIRMLGVKVVDNKDEVRVPHAFVTMQSTILYKSLIEGDAAALRGSWFKVGFYAFAILALIEAWILLWPK